MQKEEYSSILRKKTFAFDIFLLSQKILPYSRKYKTYFKVTEYDLTFSTFACCYLLVLKFLMKIMQCALPLFRLRIREGKDRPPGNFLLSTIVQAICAIKIFNDLRLVGGCLPLALSFKLPVCTETLYRKHCAIDQMFFIISFKIFLSKKIGVC